MSVTALDGRSNLVGRAIFLTLVTIAVFGVQDAISKILVQDYSSFQITMMRYWGFAAFALVMVMRQAPLRQAFRSKVPAWQVLRGLLLMADIWLFALALCVAAPACADDAALSGRSAGFQPSPEFRDQLPSSPRL